MKANWAGQRIPILMYHAISDEPEPGVTPYYKTNTSPEIFRKQMQYLSRNNYRTVHLREIVSWLEGNAGLAASTQPDSDYWQAVVITFDDGFRDFYTQAFPILQEFEFTATMFLPTGFIKESSDDRSASARAGVGFGKYSGKEFLTWTDARELHQAGICFGSHTVNHPKLVELSWSKVVLEVRHSKEMIEDRLGAPVAAFGYPFGFPQNNPAFVQEFAILLHESGYECSVTTELGRIAPGDDRFRMKRLPINGLDDELLFRAKLEGSYDWLGLAQSTFKHFKHW